MIILKDFLNKIKDFGLNSYEARLWIALLSKGTATAGDLSDIASVPRSRSYDVLESLEKKGFVIMKIGKPIKYLAVQPEQIIENIKKNIQEEAQKQEMLINTLKKSMIIEELTKLHKQGTEQGETKEIIATIKGRKNIQNQLTTMIKKSTKTINIITTQKGFIRKSQELQQALKEAYKKKIVIKIAAPITKTDLLQSKQIKEIAQLKNTENIKTRFCIIDGKNTLIFPLDDDIINQNDDFAIWSNSEFLSKGFEAIFNKIWQNMPELQ